MSGDSAALARLFNVASFPVWAGDPECVYREAACYAHLLGALGPVSRGTCRIEQVREQWHGDVIVLQFLLNDTPRQIAIKRRGDFLDFRFLTRLNHWLAAATHHFLLRATPGEPLIACLTAAEREQVEARLSWFFVSCSAAERDDFLLAPIETRLRLGDFAKVCADLEPFLAADSSDPALLYYCGVARYELGDTTGAQLAWAAAAGRGDGEVYERIVRRYGRAPFGA
jgi:hypothetical protein